MAAYDGAAKWEIFVASLAGTPPGGPPSPSGVESLPGGGVPGVLTGGSFVPRGRETRLRCIGGCDARFKAGGHSGTLLPWRKIIPMEVQ